MPSMRMIVCLAVIALANVAHGSVFLPQSSAGSATASLSARSVHSSASSAALLRRSHLIKGQSIASSSSSSTSSRSVGRSNGSTAMAIPGYGVAEQVFVGGFGNFIQAYNFIITARILLSWFPQAQSIGALQPVYAITDPYLNLFRGIIPPIFGLDLSPILAFVTLNLLTNATAAVGCDVPQELRLKMEAANIKRGLFHKCKKPSPFPLIPANN
mmetsp:Transcript_10337/g.15270  ORF Transcript_10337/g.15270 Transcript_10337/m.15270 type:complete len:214 (+) Transcript_10337:135-776(+)